MASLVGITILGISMYAGYKTYETNKQQKEGTLLLTNIEALTLSENGKYYT